MARNYPKRRRNVDIKQALRGETGASSVLVVFMILVLAALGTFAVTSANVNYTYSRRAADWTAAYYEADAEAEEFLARLDAGLALAEKRAVDFGASGVLPENPAANGAEIWEALNRAYAGYVLEGAEELRDDYPDLTIDFGGGKISVSANFQAESRRQTNLSVTLEVAPLGYVFAVENEVLSGSRGAGAPRYTITAWTQWQSEHPGEATAQPLWDGLFG